MTPHTLSTASAGRAVPMVRWALLVVLAMGAIPPVSASPGSHQMVAEALYEFALEYRRRGQLADAAHELEKVLLIEPEHAQAAEALKAVRALLAEREAAIDRAIAASGPRPAAGALPPLRPAPPQKPSVPQKPLPLHEQTRDETAPAPERTGGGFLRRLFRRPQAALPVRVPDPSVNQVKWFYVFGPAGKTDYGALAGPQRIFVELPTAAADSVRIQVLDADTGGRRDEMDGDWNTTTAFRVFGGSTQLDSRLIGPDASDGTVVEFGPFRLDQGERQGEQVLFRVEAEGIEGDDNNLFALEVSPASAQSFSYAPSIRLAEEAGTRMRFFPTVPAGATRLTEANYDLDPDGGRIVLIPATPGGRMLRSLAIKPSGSGAWATTPVEVPPGADGSRWIYQVTKGAQRKANMAFQFTDEGGRSMPIYTTRGRTVGAPQPQAVPSPQVSREQPRATCNTFKFDASGSYDPDNDRLAYAWDFGDGTTGEGIEVWHTYERAGEYRMALEVTDSSPGACGLARTEQLVRVNTPPTAKFDMPALACAGSGVRVSAAQSSDSPGEALTYRWDFGDGATGEGMDVTHAYAQGGTYTVQLMVDDGRGTSCSTDLTTSTLRVNSPPTARADERVELCALLPDEPLAVDLSGIESSDPDFDSLSYRWEFGDGSRDEGPRVSHVYARGGRYAATLTVDDGSGTSCATAATTVPVQVNHAPQVVAAPLVTGCPAEPVTFDASGSTDPDGDPLTYRWDFGDGQAGDGATVSHHYASYGVFPVTVTIDDGSGLACGAATADATADINAPPVPQISIEGENVPAPPTESVPIPGAPDL